jgi:hypothetical protein
LAIVIRTALLAACVVAGCRKLMGMRYGMSDMVIAYNVN